MKKIKSLILAGGSGTRLWPISRDTSPKQFAVLKELGGKSLFQLSLERALKVSQIEDIYVVATKQNFFHVAIQAEKLGIKINDKNIIIQPQMKETLPICALSARIIGEGNILMLPSDQLIPDSDHFAKIIQDGVSYLDKGIVAFGITPNKPETGYGYIEKDGQNKILQFHEKPNESTAQNYIEKGYVWNSGIYFFEHDFFFQELEKLNKPLKQLICDTSKTNEEIFSQIEAISFDNGISEKSQNMYCIPMTLKWSDLGSFDSIGEYMEENNIQTAQILTAGESKNNVILSEVENKEIALIDVEDLVIVDSDDVLLIAKKGSTQKVKELVKKTKKTNGNTEYRPWGSFTILSEGKGYKTKKITVHPGRKLSLQSHHHRSEHWVVVEGTALVTIGEKEIILPKGESVFVPVGEKHRLANPGKMPLSIIESQIGDYLEEDDIVRYSDDFGRN